MGVEHDSVRKLEPTTAPAAEVEALAPAPAGPVPVAVGTLVVGHAEDHAEKDADQRADTALSRLQGLEPDRHQHGPGCEHAVRRAAAPVGGAPEVGLEGGALGVDTSAAIAERRGRGRKLEEPVLRRMQTAFGTDLSAVRIHDDSTAATLNRQVSARAFTTGKDIFFGARQYAPDTTEGERVLAHELAHTLQPASPIRRNPGDAAKVIPAGAVTDKVGAIEAPTVAPGRGAAEPEELPDLDTSLADEMPKDVATLDGLRALSGPEVRKLASDTSLTGPLMTVIRGPFEANWFKAKECLVFGKWPTGKPSFSHEAALTLMKALVVLREEVHKAVMPLAGPKVRARVAAALETAKAAHGAASEEHKPALLERVTRLEKDLEPSDNKHFIDFLPSGGATTVTSDVDISTKGTYTEWGVAAYNEAFRAFAGVPYDAGTVFDLNVYAKDFIFKANERAVDTVTPTATGVEVTTDVTPGTENPVQEAELSPADRKAQDADQESWALIHVARFLDKAGWDVHTSSALLQIHDTAKRDEQRELFAATWARAEAFRARLKETMAELAATVQPGSGSAWNHHDQEHHEQGALLMLASNQIYEKELLKLKAAREEVALLQGKDLAADRVGRDRLMYLVREMPNLVSQASLYANEVYGSGGATVHAVIGMQGRKRRLEDGPTADGKAKADGRAIEKHDVVVHIPAAQWFQTFNDNLGDVMKDYDHFATKHGSREPDYWYAAFKMGKYLDRMLDAVPHLSEGADALLSPEQVAEVLDLPAYKALKKLAVEHVQKKSDVAATDPKKLAKDPFFEKYGPAQVDEVRNQALKLWAKVRGDVANGPPRAKIVPKARPKPPTTSPAPVGATVKPGESPVRKLDTLEDRTRELAEAVTGK